MTIICFERRLNINQTACQPDKTDFQGLFDLAVPDLHVYDGVYNRMIKAQSRYDQDTVKVLGGDGWFQLSCNNNEYAVRR